MLLSTFMFFGVRAMILGSGKKASGTSHLDAPHQNSTSDVCSNSTFLEELQRLVPLSKSCRMKGLDPYLISINMSV